MKKLRPKLRRKPGREMQFWAMTHKFKSVARPALQGGKIVLEESRDTKSDGFFHTLCYHNQMDNMCTGKD